MVLPNAKQKHVTADLVLVSVGAIYLYIVN
jgi:hypothetical protein